MVGELITLPFRIWLRSTQLALRVGEELTGRAAEAAFELAGAVMGARRGGQAATQPRDEAEREPPTAPDPSAAPRPSRPAPPARPRRPAPPPRPDDEGGSAPHLAPAPETVPAEDLATAEPTASPLPPELTGEETHVSAEPELAMESAEPGAEDGAGASVTVLEPWEGYGRMAARQVIDRLAAATTEELAAVQLYEGTHRNRRSVLEAVHRQLRIAAAGTSPE